MQLKNGLVHPRKIAGEIGVTFKTSVNVCTLTKNIFALYIGWWHEK